MGRRLRLAMRSAIGRLRAIAGAREDRPAHALESAGPVGGAHAWRAHWKAVLVAAWDATADDDALRTLLHQVRPSAPVGVPRSVDGRKPVAHGSLGAWTRPC